MTLEPVTAVLCCALRVRFLTRFYRISWMTERGWLEAKEKLTVDKVSMLTAVQLFTGEGSFSRSVISGLFLYMMSSSGAVRKVKLHF